jgi:glycosyltransferase involved in cell wall biosynthesis
LNREVVLHSSSWIHTLSEQLALREEIELHIITHSNLVDRTQSIKKRGINFHIINYSFPFTNRGFPWYLPIDKITGYYSFRKKAEKIIHDIQPDILHVHGTEGGYFAPAFETELPCITSIQGIIKEYVKVVPEISGYLQIPYEQKAIRKGKFFGCRTRFDFNYVRKNNKEAIIFYLPEAMNKIFFDQQWEPQSELSLLFVGSLMRRKGVEDLIHALFKLKKIFPTIQLRIIGSGEKKYFTYLNKIIEHYKLTNSISLLGNKTPVEVALELKRCNFFVLPTLIDNSPNCLAEAMAVGVPCIATKVGGIPSMVKDKHNGMLFEKHDVDGLVDIVQLLVRDKDFQKKLSTNAKAKAFERNYPANVAEKYIEVYKSLLNGATKNLNNYSIV